MAGKGEFSPIKIEDEEVIVAPRTKDGNNQRKIKIAVLVVCVIVLLIIAFIVGYFVRRVPSCEHSGKKQQRSSPTSFEHLYKGAIDGMSAERIENELRYFTSVPHIGGSNVSYQQALHLQSKWEDFGFDKVELKKYDILLSYPEKPGKTSIVANDGSTLFIAQQREEILEPAEDHHDVISPFNAFSDSGNVTGRLIYANYARRDDFKVLRGMNISCAGHIVIAKYGKIFRGDKAKFAALEGAIGLILYSDPADYSQAGANFTYPKSWWLPPTGVQRGTLFIPDGDPLTPGYPSVEGIYREPLEQVKQSSLPSIPVYPISYSDAFHFLRLLTRNEAPKDWFGDLNLTYHIQMAPGEMRNVNLDVAMKLEVKPVYNVIGVMEGASEPDRLVLLGNHRDAWIFGAVDPSSGTAAMVETARAMGELKKKGWRPRRSIVLCSWGAEEYGLMGSTEWGEEFTNILTNRAVAYLNVDSSVQGNYSLRAKTSPLLDFALFEATRKIPRPGASSSEDSVFEEWRKRRPDKKDPRIPRVSKVGSGSDYALLYHRLGVPSVDFRYIYDTVAMPVSSYPVYHSVHDTFHWMKTFVDPDFLYHRAVAQIWLQFAVLLSDSVILPFNCTRYGQRLQEYAGDIEKNHGETLRKNNITLEYLNKAVTNFSAAAKVFTSFVKAIDQSDAMKVRMVNDRLIQLEKSFTNPQGLPGRPYERHVVFAPSASNQYSGSSFPGLLDALYNVQNSDQKDWGLVAKQLSNVVFYIRTATKLMMLTSV